MHVEGGSPCALQVECYAGHKGDERPAAFRHGGRQVRVAAVVDRWYGPDHAYFKLLGDDGVLYLIRNDQETDGWELILMETRPAREDAA